MVNNIYNMFEIVTINKDSILISSRIRKAYKLPYWDSLIMATALEAGCSILYSEDFQSGQIIEKQVKMLNPFIKL